MKAASKAELAAAMELMRPVAKPGTEEYRLRAALMTELLDRYDAAEPDRIERYVEALWDEIPLWWLALAVRKVFATRVYPSAPRPGEVRRVARKLAGMDRPTYSAGVYLDAPRREWPPPARRHAVSSGEYEPLPAGEPLRLPGGERAQIGGGE